MKLFIPKNGLSFWNLKFKESTYGLDGFLAGSHATEAAQRRVSGAAGRVRFGKDGGKHWLYNAGLDFTSRAYNINDLGFFRRPNDYGGTAELRYRENRPGKIVRARELRGFHHHRWNFDEALLINNHNFSAGAEWRNYWETSVSFDYNASTYDDRETRGLGLYRAPGRWSTTIDWETDGRAPVIFELTQNYTRDAAGWRQWQTGLAATVRPTTFAELSAEFTHSDSRDREAWVENVSDALISPNPFSVFGGRDTRAQDFTLRGNLTFTRDMTLQVYSQLFLAKGHYDRFRRLLSPENSAPYDYAGDPDFNESAFNLNVVWRWEYLPGSVLYLVWTQACAGENRDYFSRWRDDFNGAFALPAQNVVLLKVSYWWSR